MKKTILAAGSAAIVISGFAGVAPTAMAAESTAIKDLQAAVESGQVKLSWTNDGESASKIYRNGTLISNLSAGATQFQDNLVNAKIQMPNLPRIIEVADFSDGSDGEKQVSVKLDSSKMTVTETLSYAVEDKNANTATVEVPLTVKPDKFFYLVNDKSTATEEELKEEAASIDLTIPQAKLTNGYLHVYAVDSVTGSKSPVKSYALANNYEGVTLPELHTVKPTISVSSISTSKEVTVTVSAPDAYKNQGVELEFRTAYGAWTKYTAPIKLTENTYVEARLKDAHGNTSQVANHNVTNIAPDFGNEFETIMDKNILTLKLKDGVTNIDRMEYSINDSAWAMYTNPIKVADGNHKVQVRVVTKDGAVSPIKAFDWNVNTDPNKDDATSTSEYKEKLKVATDLVTEAEKVKTKDSVDKARKAMEGLSITDKMMLEQRLEVVEDYVKAVDASAAVSTVKNSKTIDNLVKALVSVGQLKAGSVRSQLEKEVLDVVSDVFKNSTSSQIDKAVQSLVSDAESKPNEGHLFAMDQLMKHVSDSAVKSELEKKYKEITVLVKHADALKKAEEALKKAETTETKKNYEDAKKLVDSLPDSEIKNKMLNRLERVSKILGVISNEVIDDIVAGKEVSLSKLAGYLKMEIPSSLEKSIYAQIKALDGDASEATVRAAVELSISYDLAVRSMSAKAINDYTKVWNKNSALPTINKFPKSSTLIAIYKFLEDDSQLGAAIKELSAETGVSETSLKNHFGTTAPKVVKGDATTNLISFEDLAKLEKNYSFMTLKASILTKQFLLSKEELDSKAAISYAKTLLNGEFKQTLLSTLGVSGDELKNAGVREDKMVTGEEETKVEEGKEDPNSDLGKFLAENKDAVHLTAKDLKAGDTVKLSNDNITVTFVTDIEAKKYDVVIATNSDGETTIKLFLDGVEVTEFEGGMTIVIKTKTPEHILKINSKGQFVPINHKLNTSSIEFVIYGPTTIVFSDIEPEFQDVKGTFADKYVDELTKRGILDNGSMFSINKTMTRGEFSLILANALELTSPDGFSQFSDVSGSGYEEAINALYKAGIVNGTTASTFEPNKQLTRQQAALMLARAMDHLGVEIPAAQPNFKDTAKIANYASNAVGGLQQMGIFTGKPGNFFDPNSNLTKGETSKIIYLGLKKMGII